MGSKGELFDKLAKSISTNEMKNSAEDIERVTDDTANGNAGLQKQIDELCHITSDLLTTTKH